MLIKVALNGGRSGAPATPEEIAEDVAACAAAGASTFHVHPRDLRGSESLLPADADRVVEAIRGRVPHVALGLTTGAWILPDVRRARRASRRQTATPSSTAIGSNPISVAIGGGSVIMNPSVIGGVPRSKANAYLLAKSKYIIDKST